MTEQVRVILPAFAAWEALPARLTGSGCCFGGCDGDVVGERDLFPGIYDSL